MTRIAGTAATDMTQIVSSTVESLQTFAAAVEIVEAHGITDANELNAKLYELNEERGDALDEGDENTAASLRDTWDELNVAIRVIAEEIGDFWEASLWSMWLDSTLDVKLTDRIGQDGWEVTGAVVLVTYGGPNVIIDWRCSTNTVSVVASWWSEQSRVIFHAPGLCYALAAFAEGTMCNWGEPVTPPRVAPVRDQATDQRLA